MITENEGLQGANDKSPISDTNKKNVKHNVIKSAVLEILFWVFMFVFFLYILPNFVIERFVIDGDSMTNTLMNGDSVMVEKLSYRLGDLDRFDVIVFTPENTSDDKDLIKRIIGLPGETVQINGNRIYINGEVLEDDVYFKEEWYDTKGPIELGDDEYFVLGDNRKHSQDSRAIGPVKKSQIIGKAIFRLFPFSSFGNFDKIHESD